MPAAAPAQVENFVPVTQRMLENPSPSDWLMLSRTYDFQRFSPLDQINQQNVGRLRMAWARGMSPGAHELIPLVYRGVMYIANPVAVIQALDATDGDLLWEYRRRLPAEVAEDAGSARTRNLAIFEDMIYYASPDGYLVALDARTGALRWETLAHDYNAGHRHTSGPIVANGKVLTGRSCRTRDACFISAHDARTGRELWKFYTTAAPGEPGGDTWGALPAGQRVASPWGLPGSYDPETNLVYWGIANTRPYSRISRHNGNVDAISRSAPAELYSNSTVALNADTGELAWYYQHLPGDDWDFDHVQERILFRARFNPNPDSLKWINPRIPRGAERNALITLGEPGGLWALDRATGEFLWATPFPYDVPEFHISHIDVETGKTYVNPNLLFQKEGDRRLICFENIKNFWPMAYHPEKNSLYIPFHDSCLDATANLSTDNGHGPRIAVPRPGVARDEFAGIAKVNLATGATERIYSSAISGNGAMLATAGNLLFWGDLNRRFRAFDADSGRVLWETIVGGIVQMSTITYAVNGKQYVAVLSGQGEGATRHPLRQIRQLGTPITPPQEHNAIYVFALP